jgi:D-beta-D-heptose 7-phosphate kinase/D-beta-D-heptose 1-phosphate adenosyltransferase
MPDSPKEEWKKILGKFSSVRALVIGDVMLDVYLEGKAAGIADEAPVPLLEIQQPVCCPGGAANVALNLAALGVKTTLAGVVGRDPSAEILKELLEKTGVAFFPLTANRPTTRKLRITSSGHYFLRVDDEVSTNLPEEEATQFGALLDPLISPGSPLVLSDYAKGVFSPQVAGIIQHQARNRGVPLLGDLKPSSLGLWKSLDLLTPNRREAIAMLEGIGIQNADRLSGQELARRLKASFGCPILLKLSEQGMIALDQADSLSSFPALARNPLNTSGAGDTVLAVTAAALATGAPLRIAAQLASHAAALAIQQPDTHTVSADALYQVLNQDFFKNPC